MIKANCILLYINAPEVPFLMDETEHAWELAEFAEEYAYNIAKTHRQKTKFSLSLAPSRHANSFTARSETYKKVYKENVLAVLDKVDAIAIIPCLGSASVVPEWLRDEAEARYITIAQFGSFFGTTDSDLLNKETSRRRILLVRARRPEGREGRGARVK